MGVLSALNMVEVPIWAYFLAIVSFFTLIIMEKWPQYSGYFFVLYVVSIGIPVVYITLEGYYGDLSVARLVVGAIVGIGAMLAPVLVALNKPNRQVNSKAPAEKDLAFSILFTFSSVGILIALVAGNQPVLGLLASVFWIIVALSAVSFRKNVNDGQ